MGSTRRLRLGVDAESGEPYDVPFASLRRGVTVRGEIGSGKTTLLSNFLMTFGLSHNVLHLDFSGTGQYRFQTFLANLVAILSDLGKHSRHLRAFAQTLLTRHAFGVIDDGATSAMPIRFNVLKRYMLASGALETLAQVVDRTLFVFDLKLNVLDPQVRVRFRRVCTPILTVLAAAERVISEGVQLLDDRLFAAFVLQQIESRSFSAVDRAFLGQQVHEFRQTLSLYDPDKPATRRYYLEQTESTRNALMDFVPGTALGRFLGSSETFAPEDVAFGRQSLSLSTRLADSVKRKQAFQAVHGIFHPLFASRVTGSDPYVPVTVVTDEIKWLPFHIADAMAIARNVDVSYILAFQNLAQWKDIGLDTMPEQLATLAALEISMRPNSRAEAEDEVLHTRWIHPGDVVQTFHAHSSAHAETRSKQQTDGVNTSDGTMRQHSRGTATGRSAVASVSAGVSEHEGHASGTSMSSSRGHGEQRGESKGGGESTFESASESDSYGTNESDGYGSSGDQGMGMLFGRDGEIQYSEREGIGDSSHHSAGSSSSQAYGSAKGSGTVANWGKQEGASEFWSDSDGSHESTSQGTGKTRGRSRSRGRSSIESDSASEGVSHSEGTTRAVSTGEAQQVSASESDVLHILSCDEQLFPLMQQALRRPRLLANVRFDGSGRVIRLAPAIEYPAVLCGVPVHEQFLASQEAYFESRSVAPAPYTPHAFLVGSVAPPAAQHPAAVEPEEPPPSPTPAPTIPRRPIARGRGDRRR